ncbi:MAG: BMP family ABC transporter substrate-binding protein [Spirochaetales bacterium]|nr:BMP family ABC transporter substrate-binding protein [Spirochaetales bacterium]
MKRIVFLALAVAGLWSCGGTGGSPAKPASVAVFVPGVASGSPIYEMLVSGAARAVEERPGTEFKVIEGGYDQSGWLDALKAIAASGEFDLIVTSNPALPELCVKVAAEYPEVRFFVADAYMDGQRAIHTVLYNQLEQGYLVGYLAGALSVHKGSNRAGLIAAQRYPTLDRLIQPGFEAGLLAADPGMKLEYREIGNWYDANRAAELAASLYNDDVEVILAVAGGAGQGVIAAAGSAGASVVWLDGAGYQLGPDVVVGCATLAQDRLVYERVSALLDGKDLWGVADIVGATDGYVGFDRDGPAYKALPESLRAEMDTVMAKLAEGKPAFTLDSF